MNQILYSRKTDNRHQALVIASIVILIVLALMFGFGLANMANEKILNGVSIAGIDVSKMNKEEALAALVDSASGEEANRLAVNYNDVTIAFNSDEICYGYNFSGEHVDKAYSYGRDGNIIENNFTVLGSLFNKKEDIAVEKTVDIQKLKDIIYGGMSSMGVPGTNDYYEISGDKLVLYKGIEGQRPDFEKLEKDIIEAIKNGDTDIEASSITAAPEPLDMDEVYSKVHSEPVNASYVPGKKAEIVIEENGLDFDLEDAKAKYAELEYGESVEVDLEVVKPEVTLADLGDVLFENLISTYSSEFDTSDTDRVTNLEVAAARCNNTILYPGDEFSFNKALGHRTVENGYKNGNSFAGGKVVKTVGGGICQVSSSLYNAALRADLTITDRTAHGMYVQYVEQSTDATVVDNAIDFKFKNNREFPIKIVTTCKDGVVTASIYGYKSPDEYDIDIEVKILETKPYTTQKQNDSTMKKGTTKVVQNPVNGYVSEAYKVYYKDGKEVSRKLISKDTYAPINEIIKVGTKSSTPVKPKQPITPVVEPVVEPVIDKPILPPGWDNPESGY